MSERAEMIAMDTRLYLVPEREGWEFEAAGRWAWLSRLCWAALRKLNAVKPHWGKRAVYKFQPIEHKKIADRILTAIDGRIRNHEDLNAYAIVMGQKDYHEFMYDEKRMVPLGSQTFTFNAGRFGYRDKIFDVPVHVVETISGVALIPKVAIENRRP